MQNTKKAYVLINEVKGKKLWLYKKLSFGAMLCVIFKYFAMSLKVTQGH